MNKPKTFNKKNTLKNNTRALEIILKKQHKELTNEEKRIIDNYAGFGGIKEVLLPLEKDAWTQTDLKVYDEIQHLHDVIKSNTTEDNYHKIVSEIKANTLTAFYTPQDISDTIIQSLKSKGLEAHTILENSAGSGRIVKSINEAYPDSEIKAIEKDYITSQILAIRNSDKKNVIVQNTGFEKINPVPSDLVVSNIPFGQIKVFDKDFFRSDNKVLKSSCNRIHNYFFVKGIDHLKDKGVLAYITTSGFADSKANQEFRQYLMNKTDLINIVRFPNNMFKGEAGTEVGTDLIILQKNDNKSKLTSAEKQFVRTIQIDDISINCSFVDEDFKLIKEKIICDEIIQDTDQYGRKAFQYIINDTSAINNALQANLNKNVKLTPQKLQEKKVTEVEGQLSLFDTTEYIDTTIPLNENWYKNNMLYVHNNKIVLLNNVDNEKLKAETIPTEFNYYERKVITDYVILRDSYYRLANKEDELKAEAPELRKNLNYQYSEFIRKYNILHSQKIDSILNCCSSYEHVASTLERREIENNKYTYVKGDFLYKSKYTITQPVAYKIEDAINLSLNKYGKVYMKYIQLLTQKSKPELYEETKGILYANPQSKNWETADQFLSGNVAEKKKYFEDKFTEKDFQKNKYLRYTYDAICSVQPEKIPFDIIDFNLGERWIDTDIYEEFAKHLFDEKSIRIKFVNTLDTFKCDYNKSSSNPKIEEEYAVQSQSRKYRGLDLFEHAIHNTTPNVNKNLGTSKNPVYVRDNEATQEASNKIEDIRNKFSLYLKQTLSDVKKKELEDQYNFIYNGTVKQKYNGDHLKFSDLQNITPYPHQRDGIWMLMQNNGGIIDHPVGSGKTLTMCITAHEMKRIGIARKPAIIGLKANIQQLAEQYKSAYPKDKLLYVTPKDFDKKNRKNFFNQLQNQDWDCIIMTHEQFEKIPQSREVQKKLISEELRNIEKDLDALKYEGKVSKKILNGLEQRKISKEVQLEKLYAKMDKDDMVDFEKIGIDHLFVDESQKFKNLEYTTRHTRVAGLGSQTGSQRSFNLLTAIRTIQNRNEKDLGVTFLSGTTISNSLTEMYLLYKYLRPKALEKQNIPNFDSWAAVFAQKSTEYEFNITNELTMKERFRTFIKVPELAAFYNEITDFKSFDDLNLDRPIEDVELVTCKQSKDQKEYANKLILFAKTGDANHIGRKKLSEKEKNSKMLIATNYAKKMAMDMRLVNRKYEDNPESKISICCKNIAEYYNKSTEYKGTQAVFCDIGTPGTKGFNIYNAIKQKLIDEYNIPANEIAFVHTATTDKKRDALFTKVNAGEIRITLGSTEKMGTGVNMQERMVAMHDLDIPWRPSDLEQRHGRGARQGNWVAKEHFANKVKTFVYATENTLDVYKFNLLKNKQLFIDQIKTDSMHSRTIDEGSMDESSGMSFAEYVAVLSGNNDLLEKAKIDNKITKIESEKAVFLRDKNNAQKKYDTAINDIDKSKKYLKSLKSDNEYFESVKQINKNNSIINAIKLDNQDCTILKPEEIGNKIIDIFNQNRDTEYKNIGELYGFNLYVRYNEIDQCNKLYVFSRDNTIKYTFNNGYPKTDNPSYASRYFLSALAKNESLIRDNEYQIIQNEKKMPVYKSILEKEWSVEKEKELKELKKQSSDIDNMIKNQLNGKNDKSNDNDLAI